MGGRTFDHLAGDHEVRDVARLGDLHCLVATVSLTENARRNARSIRTPRIATSMCPPRIISNDSAESTVEHLTFIHSTRHEATRRDAPKTEAPGRSVTVSLPALIMSLVAKVPQRLEARPQNPRCGD